MMFSDPVEILKQLIRFPTYQISKDKVEDGMKECASFLADSLEELGFSVLIDGLCNVTGERTFGGGKTFLMNTHFDTIPPASSWENALTPVVEGDELYGLGSSDAKAGIAATLSALSRLSECRFGKLIAQFVNYEDNVIEIQGKRMLGTPYFLSKNPDFKADYGINIEPTVVDNEWTVSLGCTGRLYFTVTTIGEEAHSATPHLGKNAIYEMTKVLKVIDQISPGKFKINGFEAQMPINVAMINGGRAINIVPGECKITCERRFFPSEKHQTIMESIQSALQRIEDTKVTCDFRRVQLPYLVDKNDEIVTLLTRSIFNTLGQEPDIRILLGRTDSIYLYHDAGIKTAIIGPGHTGHVPYECVNIDRMLEFGNILENILNIEK